jgi:hypothetical protein
VAENAAIASLYFDGNTEEGKKLRAEAERLGIRPPEEVDRYLAVLNILENRKQLNKRNPRTGELTPFTLEETYRYLASTGQLPESAPAPAQAPAAQPPANPRVAAQQAAIQRAASVASDVPPGSPSGGVDVSKMTDAQKSAIIDTPVHILRSDPARKALYDAVYRSLNVEPTKF